MQQTVSLIGNLNVTNSFNNETFYVLLFLKPI